MCFTSPSHTCSKCTYYSSRFLNTYHTLRTWAYIQCLINRYFYMITLQPITNTVQDKILERKFWQICRILPNSPKFSCSIKKIDFEKLIYREYSPIYYPPIIADSSFAKFLPPNFCLVGYIILQHQKSCLIWTHTLHMLNNWNTPHHQLFMWIRIHNFHKRIIVP